MKRITALAAALLLALSLLTGCAQIDEAEEPLFPPEEDPAPEETAAALPSAFSLPYLAGQPLNPLTCPDGMQQTAASLLYEGLFHLDGQFTPQPLLCASYTYDPEALTYVLTLRQGVVFSDGSPLTAADVKATLTAARSSARYAPRLADVKSISAGNGTVTLTLSRPNSALPALLDIPILKSGTEKKDIPTGTGPYLYDESSTPCLLASQNWWQGGGQPVERIVLTETADAESMLYRFTSHDVQLLVSDLTGTDSVTVSGSVRCTDADTSVFQYLGINTTVKPLDDAAFRRCLSLGLNRQALVSGLLSGHARAAQFPVSPVSPLYPSELDTAFSATAFADALAACEKLEMLNISYTKAEDLAPLENLPLTHLVAVGGTGTRLGQEQQEAFETAHPDCQNLWRGTQEYGVGWRYVDKETEMDWYAQAAVAFKYPHAPNNVGWYLTTND